MGEDEIVAMYLSDAGALIRGIVREANLHPEWCAMDRNEQRCYAAIQCSECVLRTYIGQGTDEE